MVNRIKSIKNFTKRVDYSASSLAFICALTSLLYVFMEWTYSLDKSATVSINASVHQAMVMLNAAIFLALLCAGLSLLIFFVSKLTILSKARWLIAYVPILPSAFLLTTMLLLFIDNITYTFWEEGIVTSHGFTRVIYSLAFTLLLGFMMKWCVGLAIRITKKLKKTSRRSTLWLTSICLAASLILLIMPVALNTHQVDNDRVQNAAIDLGARPNILLITVDSLNASAMSVYGYPEETTPFLDQFAGSSLVGINHFTNAQGTIGSLSSLLTSKYPSDTRVLASEDVLRGEDAYQHLPALLKEYGYSTAQLSFSYYADADNLNIQNGFDLANNRTANANRITSKLAAILPTDNYFFLRGLYTRATDRVGHIYFIRDMSNPYKQVTQSPARFNDSYKLDTALILLEEAQEPMFIHIHWMGTHGPKYYPETQVFSAGHDPQTQGNREEIFYLDSILEFDNEMEDFITELENTGLLGNTLIIITADHSLRWNVTRLPLILYFPESSMTGTITSNTENLDIAPTLLDYLDIPTPDWMSGQSLLDSEYANRPIFIAQIFSSNKDPVTGKITYPESVAPFYQFGRLSIIQCDTVYTLNLQTLVLSGGKVRPYSGKCTGPELDATQALLLIREHLSANGFDVSTLNNIVVGQ